MKRVFYRVITILWCTLMVLVVAVPLYLCIVNAFKPNIQSLRSYLTLPTQPTLEHFSFLIQEKGYLSHLASSLLITLVSALLCSAINSFVGFMIADNWTRKAYRWLYLFLSACMMIPSSVMFFPLIRQFYAWELMNRLGLILYYTACMIPESVFMLVPLMRTSNLSIREAAMLDGCNRMQYFAKIFLPTNAAACTTVTILNVIWIWNDFLIPLMVLNSNPDIWTLPIFLYSNLARSSASKNTAFAACVLTLLPILILYGLLHKKIIGSIMTRSAGV